MFQLALIFCALKQIYIFYCLSLSSCKIILFKIFIFVVRRHLRIVSLLMRHQIIFGCRICSFDILRVLLGLSFLSFSLNDNTIEFRSRNQIQVRIDGLLNSYFLCSDVSKRFIILIRCLLFRKELRPDVFFDSVQRSVIIYVLFRFFSIWN